MTSTATLPATLAASKPDPDNGRVPVFAQVTGDVWGLLDDLGVLLGTGRRNRTLAALIEHGLRLAEMDP